MSVAFAEPVLDRPSTDVRVGRPGTAPARTTPRRPGPGVGPDARPRRVRFTAPAVPGGRPGSRACRPAPAAAATSARTWHLTDRGMAVVLVVAAALVAASIAVVGLTALRVTGESYQAARTTASAPVLVER